VIAADSVDTTVVAAFAVGFVSFISPCVLPLVPGYLAAVTGVPPSELEKASTRSVLVPALLFIASFSVIFILLGLTATAIGETLRDNQRTLEKIAGALMIAMGVLFIASMFVARLNREWRVDALMERAGTGGPIVAGAAFSIAWAPCTGPTLAAIYSLAAVQSDMLEGVALMLAYSAGLAIPFLLTAVAFSKMTNAFTAIKRHYAAITVVGGLILIGMGILVVTGEFFQLNIEAQKLTNDLGLNQ
jgi:cytochrome c-type biogenesis protein